MKTKSTTMKFLVIFILLFLAVSPLYATGERTSIAGISMGRSFVAFGRGLEAIGTNPANLTFPHRERLKETITETISHDTIYTVKDLHGNDSTVTQTISHDTSMFVVNKPPTVSFSIPALTWGFNFGSDFVNYDIYKEYFTGVDDIDGDGKRDPKFLSDADKNNILEIFPSGLAETHFDFEFRLFGLTVHHDLVGDIGLTVTDRASVAFDLPKDYVRLFLFGLDSLGSSYDFSGTDVRGWYIREYSLSYARPLPMLNYKYFSDVSAGLSIKLLHGYADVTTDHYNATFSNRVNPRGGWDLVGNFDSKILRSTVVDPDSNDNDFSPFQSPAGTGFGIDLGVSAEVYQAIRAGISITDIGSITWTKFTKETIGSGSFTISNPFNTENLDSIENAFKGKDTTTGEYSTTLPTRLRLGAAVQVDQLPFVNSNSFPGQLLVSIEYQQGFNLSPGNTTRARFALGAEYRPVLWLPIRTGLSFGGVDRFNWAAGLGLDFGGFNWNFGTENVGILFSPSNWDQASFGMSMIVRI